MTINVPHNKLLVRTAQALTASIKDHGELAGFAEIVAKLFAFGHGFPRVVVGTQDQHVTWKDVSTVMQLHPNAIDGMSSDDAAIVIRDLLTQHCASELSDLFANGDTASDDSLLCLMDGLRKRTEWPRAFVISHTVPARVSINAAGLLDVEVRLSVTTVE